MRPISDRGQAFPGGVPRVPRSDARITVPDPPLGGPRGEARSRAGPTVEVGGWRRRGGGGAGNPDHREVEHR